MVLTKAKRTGSVNNKISLIINKIIHFNNSYAKRILKIKILQKSFETFPVRDN